MVRVSVDLAGLGRDLKTARAMIAKGLPKQIVIPVRLDLGGLRRDVQVANRMARSIGGVQGRMTGAVGSPIAAASGIRGMIAQPAGLGAGIGGHRIAGTQAGRGRVGSGFAGNVHTRTGIGRTFGGNAAGGELGRQFLGNTHTRTGGGLAHKIRNMAMGRSAAVGLPIAAASGIAGRAPVRNISQYRAAPAATLGTASEAAGLKKAPVRNIGRLSQVGTAGNTPIVATGGAVLPSSTAAAGTRKAPVRNAGRLIQQAAGVSASPAAGVGKVPVRNFGRAGVGTVMAGGGVAPMATGGSVSGGSLAAGVGKSPVRNAGRTIAQAPATTATGIRLQAARVARRVRSGETVSLSEAPLAPKVGGRQVQQRGVLYKQGFIQGIIAARTMRVGGEGRGSIIQTAKGKFHEATPYSGISASLFRPARFTGHGLPARSASSAKTVHQKAAKLSSAPASGPAATADITTSAFAATGAAGTAAKKQTVAAMGRAQEKFARETTKAAQSGARAAQKAHTVSRRAERITSATQAAPATTGQIVASTFAATGSAGSVASAPRIAATGRAQQQAASSQASAARSTARAARVAAQTVLGGGRSFIGAARTGGALGAGRAIGGGIRAGAGGLAGAAAPLLQRAVASSPILQSIPADIAATVQAARMLTAPLMPFMAPIGGAARGVRGFAGGVARRGGLGLLRMGVRGAAGGLGLGMRGVRALGRVSPMAGRLGAGLLRGGIGAGRGLFGLGRGLFGFGRGLLGGIKGGGGGGRIAGYLPGPTMTPTQTEFQRLFQQHMTRTQAFQRGASSRGRFGMGPMGPLALGPGMAARLQGTRLGRFFGGGGGRGGGGGGGLIPSPSFGAGGGGNVPPMNQLMPGRAGGAPAHRVGNLAAAGGLGAFVGGSFKGALGLAGIGAAMAALYAPIAAIKQFARFEQETKDIEAVQRMQGYGGTSIQRLVKQARAIGRTTQYSAVEVARVQGLLSRRGYGVPAVEGMTPAVVNLAAASRTDLQTAGMSVGGMLQQFGLPHTDALKVADMVSLAGIVTPAETPKLVQALMHAGNLAEFAGLRPAGALAALGAAMSTIHQPGIAGRGMRAAMRESMQKDAKELFGKFQISPFDEEGRFNFVKFVKQMEKVFPDMSREQRAHFLFESLETQGGAFLASLLSYGGDALEGLTNRIEKESPGTSTKMRELQDATIGRAAERLADAFSDLGFTLITPFANGIREFLDGFAYVIGSLAASPVLASAMEAISSFFGIVKQVFNAGVDLATDANTGLLYFQGMWNMARITLVEFFDAFRFAFDNFGNLTAQALLGLQQSIMAWANFVGDFFGIEVFDPEKIQEIGEHLQNLEEDMINREQKHLRDKAERDAAREEDKKKMGAGLGGGMGGFRPSFIGPEALHKQIQQSIVSGKDPLLKAAEGIEDGVEGMAGDMAELVGIARKGFPAVAV